MKNTFWYLRAKANTLACTCAHNKQFVWYCSKWEGLLRMCCKQAELRPDLSYNSSRNRLRPTLPSNPPHTRAWGWQRAAGHSLQLLRARRRERELDVRGAGLEKASGSKVEVGSMCLGFRQNLSEKHWDWWGERDHRSRFEYMNLSSAKCVWGKSKSMCS